MIRYHVFSCILVCDFTPRPLTHPLIYTLTHLPSHTSPLPPFHMLSSGGPHNHTISALATALKQCNTPEYKAYQQQVMKNSKRLADVLMARNYSLVSECVNCYPLFLSHHLREA